MSPLSRLSNALLTSVALLSTCIAEKLSIRNNVIQDRRGLSLEPAADQYHFLPPIPALSSSHHAGAGEHQEELELLDVCLVASVDGKFHALNRSSGQVLWSMGSSATAPAAGDSGSEQPAALGPLVRTQHPDPDPIHDHGDETKELYIIEPQSGDIYVLPKPDEPLQRLPFTMPQLVDMSPFDLPGDDEHRVFVGKKETSLLVLELETGRLKGTINANMECPWDPFGDYAAFGAGESNESREDNKYVDLDELDGTKPPRVKPVSTEVLIGRTDYHVSIHTRPKNPSDPRPPVQNLTFSTYGPNNQDLPIQSTYRRTPDDVYIQPTAAGEIMSFRTTTTTTSDKTTSVPLWGVSFNSPVVAVFDILQQPSRASPMALLQPQPRLQDFIPNFSPSSSSSSAGGGEDAEKNNLDGGTTYVGMIPENRALYALSPQHYPLAIFARPNWMFAGRRWSGRLGIEGSTPPPTGEDGDVTERDLPLSVDDVTRLLRERARCAYPNLNKNKNENTNESERDEKGRGDGGSGVGKWDRSCVVGARPVAAAGQSRLSRLLPDRPYYEQQHHLYETKGGRPLQFGSGAAASGGIAMPNVSQPAIEGELGDGQAAAETGRMIGTFGGSVLALGIFFVGLWFISRKTSGGTSRGRGRTGSVSNANISPPSIMGAADDTRIQQVKAVDFAQPGAGAGFGSGSSSSGESKPLPALPENAANTVPETREGRSSTGSSSSNDDFVMVPRAPPMVTSSSPSPPEVGPTPGKTPAMATNVKVNGNEGADDGEGDEDSGHEGDNADNAGATPGKKRGTRRRKRGKKNKGNTPGNIENTGNAEEEGNGEVVVVPPTPTPGAALIPSQPSQPIQAAKKEMQLVVSEEVLGYGSHGTVVYRGSLQGRPVAVKRLLKDFVTLASREVTILQESDDHPNVIRYYYQESHANFLYIALELCPASLADVIEHPDVHRELSNAFDPKRALQQIASGLRHLHALKIVHRDIKPQNILISAAKKGVQAGVMAGHRMLISDFGLCKRLEVDQTSFLPTAHGAGVGAAGTVGWRAPEILRGEVNLDDPSAADDSSTQSSRGSSVGTATGEQPTNPVPRPVTRLTKSVDIFALGCLFYYILTSGGHPYGDRYEREANILKDTKNLSSLEAFGEEGLEAIDLITLMLDPDPSKRPDTTTCLTHPFFWNPARRLAFLQDASDRFEIMCRDPRDPDLVELEKGAYRVVGNDWQSRLDKGFLDNLGKFRKYDGKSVQDLMRALRNKKHHYQDLPENVKRHLGPLPDGFLSYFTRRFPHLFMHVHSVVSRTNLRYESMFKSYFELSD